MRSIRERIVHTPLFEVLAISIVTPAVSWATGASLANAGALSIVISVAATLANYGWTMLFDRWVPTRQRGFWVRAAQAAGLEVIITAYTIPLVILFTDAPMLTAVKLDVSAIGFFIVFGLAYNAAFDTVVTRLQQVRGSASQDLFF